MMLYFCVLSEHDMKLYTKLEGLPSYLIVLTVITIDNILMPCDLVCSDLWRVKQGLSYFMNGVRV